MPLNRAKVSTINCDTCLPLTEPLCHWRVCVEQYGKIHVQDLVVGLNKGSYKGLASAECVTQPL